MIDPNRLLINGLVCGFGGVLLGLAVSKYSAREAYDMGYTNGITQTESHRMQSCMAWWFEDSALRIEQARIWMCGNDLRRKR